MCVHADEVKLTTRRKRRFVAVLLSVALLAAACSGDDGAFDSLPEDRSGDSTTTEVDAPPTDPDGIDPDEAANDRDEPRDVDGTAGLSDFQRDHLVDDVDATWDVTYADDTTVVGGDALDALKRSERASGTYVFDRSAAEAAGLDLDEGQVLLLAGSALRRITSARADGGEITVQTEQASLADAIDEGTVAWDVPITFDFDQFATEIDPDRHIGTNASSGSLRPAVHAPDAHDPGTPRLTQVAMAMPDGSIVPVQSGDEIAEALADAITVKPEDGAVEWVYESGGTKYQFRLTAKGDSVDILVVVSRGGDDPTMAFRAEGTIGTLRSKSSNSYSGGSLADSSVALDQLSVDLDLSASAAAAGVSPVDLKIPVPMLTYTWLVGPVPVTLDLKADIIGNISAQAKASATAKASFTYRGDAGFEFEGADVTASGNTDIASIDPEPADSAAPMGVDVDAQFGVAFPSVSLSVFGQGLMPSLHFGAVIGSNLKWGDPAAGFAASSICKSAYVRTEVVAGYDFEILGHSLASDSYTLHQDKNETKNDGCPEE